MYIIIMLINACTSMHICFGEEYDLDDDDDDEPPCGHRGCPAPPWLLCMSHSDVVRYGTYTNGLHYYYYMLTD